MSGSDGTYPSNRVSIARRAWRLWLCHVLSGIKWPRYLTTSVSGDRYLGYHRACLLGAPACAKPRREDELDQADRW
jgi:hypothetical protein